MNPRNLIKSNSSWIRSSSVEKIKNDYIKYKILKKYMKSKMLKIYYKKIPWKTIQIVKIVKKKLLKRNKSLIKSNSIQKKKTNYIKYKN